MNGFEPERYELTESVAYDFELTRREMFRLFGGGLIVLAVSGEAGAQESGGGRRGSGRPQLPKEIGAWLHVGEDGTITVYTGKAEVGQNIRTSLTMVVADELRVPVERIRMVMGDTDLTPFDMGTFGSRTTPDMASRLRRVSAATRETLIDMAAEQWKVDRATLTNRTLPYHELTKGQKLMKAVPDSMVVTPAVNWIVTGKSAPKVNGRAFVTGKHQYSTDVRLDGMLYGKVLRAPSVGATLASVDSAAVKNATVVRDGEFVGVAAATPEQAVASLAAIRAEWKATEQPAGKDLYDSFRPASTLQHRYTVAYIAHVPLEPRAAVAQWQDGKLTVWTGTQRPFGVRTELAAAFKIPETQVRVIVPDTGSGYGGKHTGEAALEAARLALATKKPVKLVWTREEEFQWAYLRPAGVIEVSSRLNPDGTIAEWDYHNYNSGGSSVRSPYDVPNQRSEFHAAKSPLRQGSYRGLAATANHFARESHMDELALEAKLDPLAFRLKNCRNPRLAAVLEAAAKSFGWSGRTRGAGIAGGTEKGSYVASAVQVSTAGNGAVKVERVVTAFECGAILNPDHLKHQVEGSVVMGLGGALFEAIEFDRGKILNPRLSRYRVPRFADIPKLETVLLDRKDLPSEGAGETPIVALAPAIANAIFDATGERVRSMPLLPAMKKRSSD